MNLKMAKNFFIFLTLGVFSVTFAFVFDYNFNVIKNLTDETTKKILKISTILDETSEYYSDMIADRFECFQWECIVQERNANKSTVNVVINGLIKNKKFTSFQCISNKSRETLNKLNAKCSVFPQKSEEVLKNGLEAVLPFRLLIPGYRKYVEDLYQTKMEELRKTNNEETKKKIFLEVENKIKFSETTLEQISAHMENSKNKFFEIYVDFIHAEETSLRKIQREGNQNMLKCIA